MLGDVCCRGYNNNNVVNFVGESNTALLCHIPHFVDPTIHPQPPADVDFVAL